MPEIEKKKGRMCGNKTDPGAAEVKTTKWCGNRRRQREGGAGAMGEALLNHPAKNVASTSGETIGRQRRR